MTVDGRYTAKEVNELLNDMELRLTKKINQVIVVGKNGEMPVDSNPTSLLISVEEDRHADNIAAFTPKPPTTEPTDPVGPTDPTTPSEPEVPTEPTNPDTSTEETPEPMPRL